MKKGQQVKHFFIYFFEFYFFLIFSFIFISWRLITLPYCSGFAIHWHESAMDLHVFPIPSLWVFPVHRPWALVSCMQPGLVISFTLDTILVSMLLSQNIPPWPSPTESKSLFYVSFSVLHIGLSLRSFKIPYICVSKSNILWGGKISAEEWWLDLAARKSPVTFGGVILEGMTEAKLGYRWLSRRWCWVRNQLGNARVPLPLCPFNRFGSRTGTVWRWSWLCSNRAERRSGRPRGANPPPQRSRLTGPGAKELLREAESRGAESGH